MNKKYKEDFLRAGELAGKVRSFGKSLIKKGASYNDVIAKVNQKILELGGYPAFPPQMALGSVAAHFLPGPGKDVIFSDEVVKLDVGVSYNGAIGDCAVTIDLSGKYQTLIDAAEAALLAAEQSIKVGQRTHEIGAIIEKTITSYGFNPIRNLSGHGLGPYQIHTPPTIPNYDDESTVIIRPAMTFAIEPFATTGKGWIYEVGEATIFALLAEKPITAQYSALFAKIKSFNGLPFAMHDLISETLPLQEVQKGLLELMKAHVITGYPPLVEESYGIVAQAENSVLIDEKGKVFITTRTSQ